MQIILSTNSVYVARIASSTSYRYRLIEMCRR